MNENIRLLLDPRVMTENYSRRSVIRPRTITDDFYQNPENIDGEKFKLFFDPEQQKPVPSNVPGSPANVLELASAKEREVGMLYTYNQVRLDGTVLAALREPNSTALQEMGRTEVSRQIAHFKEKHAIFKEACLASILSRGVVYLDSKSGSIVESSGSSVVTCDFGVSSSHKTNLGGIISALWTVAGTSIAGQLDSIRDQADKDGVETPTEIYLHANNKKYLRANTEFQTWAAHNNRVQDEVLRGNIIEGLWGFNWHFVGGYYVGTDGNKKPFWPTDIATICPAPTGSWIKASAGSNLVPSTLDVQTNVDSALSNMQKFYGGFAYANLSHNPTALNLYMGDLFGLNFVDPDAVWMATAFV